MLRSLGVGALAAMASMPFLFGSAHAHTINGDMSARVGSSNSVITHIEGKPLVDASGEASPVRIRQAQETTCTTSGGSFRPGPVRLTYGNAVFPKHKCFERRGTINPGISGVDALYAGDWSGAIYYETATQCVAMPFKPRQTHDFDSVKICILDIA